MSNHAIRSYHERKESGEQSNHSYQHAWMAHWSRTSKEASLAQNHQLVEQKKIEGNSGPAAPARQQLLHLSGPDAATDASNCTSKVFTEVPVAGTANVPDESVTVFSQCLSKERLEHGQPFPMFGLSQNRDKGILTMKDGHASFYGQATGPQIHKKSGPGASPGDLVKREKMSVWNPSGYETRPQEHLLNLEGTSHDFVEKNSLVVSASFKDDFLGSSCRSPIGDGAGGLEKVNGPSSYLTTKSHLLNTSLTELEPDQCNYHKSSAGFVHRQGNDPLVSKNQLTLFFGNNEYQESLKSRFATGFFQSRTSPFEVAGAECSSRTKNSFFDVETMRICTTIDSAEGSKLHQTMKELFFTEKRTKANSSRGGKIFGESTTSTTTQLNGRLDKLKVSGLSRSGGFNNHLQGVKLQPLWSSTDSEEKDGAVDLKNESSAETNTLDIDVPKEDHPYGEAVSLPSKDCAGFLRLLASIAAAKFTSEGNRREHADLPSSDHKYLALPSGISSSTGDKEPSTSKTQSLDAANLLPDDDWHISTNLKSRLRSTQSEPDPGIRWAKRPKISASESLFAHGSKMSKMEEATPSPMKINPFLGKIMKQAVTSSKPLISQRAHERKPILPDQNDRLAMKEGGSDPTSESMGTTRAELLSHTWIRRWCRDQSKVRKRKKPEEANGTAFMFCEPRNLKVSLDEIQKRHFPSIAAMALMGKAMNGFHPCEFKKRGSFVVWNTKGL